MAKVKIRTLTHTFCSSLAADTQGNLYLADTSNHRIRRISLDGSVTTVAGSGVKGHQDGKAEEAQFGNCFGIAVGSDGTIYVSDSGSNTIRRIKDGVVSTLAGKPREKGFKDGKGEEAKFFYPYGMCLHSDGSLLVADYGNYAVRRVTQDGVVSTLVGGKGEGTDDGDLSQAKFRGIYDVCTDGENVYVADGGGDAVRKISEGRVVSLKVNSPFGIAFLNGTLFTVSFYRHRIYRGEDFELFAGTGEEGHKDGKPLGAKFYYPYSVVGSNGSLYVSDREDHCIRKITLFVEWRPDTHKKAPKQTRDTVRTLVMIRRRSGNVWNGVPRDVLFLICSQLHRILAHQDKEEEHKPAQKRQRL